MRNKKSKRIKAYIIFLLLIIQLLFLSGCWNNRDLTDINLVAGFGIDKTEDGKILLTVQVVEPAAIQSASSGQGSVGGQQPKPVFVESSEGDTVFEAIRRMLSKVDKKLFASTAQILILGESISKDGINEILDFFQRNHEVKYELDVLVARGVSSREILEIESDIDSIPAMYIRGIIENNVSRGMSKKTMLIDLIKDINFNGNQFAIGQITKVSERAVAAEGIAVFSDGKLVGWLNPTETRGYLFAVNKIRSTIVNILTDDTKAAMEILRSKGKFDVEFENGKPARLTVKVRLDANVGEYWGKVKLDSPDLLDKLEELLSEEVKKEIKLALDRTQRDYSSDIFGFRAKVYKYHPQYLKEIDNKWNDIFSKLPVEINVDAKIRRTGLIKKQ